MATYTDKIVLKSASYNGRTYYHDNVADAKTHYEELMGDPNYLADFSDDVIYHIYPATIASPDA